MRGTILTIQKSVAASDHHTRCIISPGLCENHTGPALYNIRLVHTSESFLPLSIQLYDLSLCVPSFYPSG